MLKKNLDKNTLKQFISDNRLNETVKNLIFQLNEFLDKNQNDIDFEPIRKLADALIINSGKLNGLEHDKIIGIIDQDTQRGINTEVQNAVLYIIEQLPKQFWNYRSTQTIKSYKSQLIEKVEILQQQSLFHYDIFICFSTIDRENAKPIWEFLRGYGFNVFVSDEELQNTVGFNFLNKIDFALGNSQHMILVASKNSLNSIYVQDEYQSFYSDCHVKNPNKRLLIVYKLGDFQIEDLPRILRTKQVANSTEQIVATLVQENLLSSKKAHKPQIITENVIEKTVSKGKKDLSPVQIENKNQIGDLLKNRLSDEVKMFVKKTNGELNHLNWLDFRDDIYQRLGKMDERKLAEMFETERILYQNEINSQQEELEKQRQLETTIKTQAPLESLKFVESKKGIWNHLDWIDFRDNMYKKFGAFDERQLGQILENERQNYLVNIEKRKQQEKEDNAINFLFPLDGVILGKTTVNELSQLGKRTTMRKDTYPFDYYDCYIVNGFDVWYDNERKIANHYYIVVVNNKKLPIKWKELGIDWAKSYNDWTSWAKKLELKIEKNVAPVIKRFQGHDSFSAKLNFSYVADKIKYQIELDFNYSKGTSADDKNTLYSLRIRC